LTTRRQAAAVTVETAGPADAGILSQVIADAFFSLAPSQWLIPVAAERRDIFPRYFRIFVDHALTTGAVHTTPDRTAAALWLPAGLSGRRAPDDYARRLAAVTGQWLARFEVFDDTLDRHHPTSLTHYHLAMLAVDPRHQHRGIGTALLQAQHQLLDQRGIPAYLEASGPDTRQLYLRHGYEDYGRHPIRLPDGGPEMFPMIRRPRLSK
jgi:GNAT superfamily N-acetyltransferase